MENRLTDKEFWDKDYKSLGFFPMEPGYCLTKSLYRFFGDPNWNKRVFEVGCFPGRFLYHFWKMGYELNWVDQTDYLPRMQQWLKEEGFWIGKIIQGDFFEDDFWRYDIVFSSGFIEHFTNFEEVIERQMQFVAQWGHICITVPNFRGGIQKFLHNWLDKENLLKHYLPSMDPYVWEKVAERNWFEVCASEYVGWFGFWTASDSLFHKIAAKIIRIFFCWSFLPNGPAYSPEIFFVARKM